MGLAKKVILTYNDDIIDANNDDDWTIDSIDIVKEIYDEDIQQTILPFCSLDININAANNRRHRRSSSSSNKETEIIIGNDDDIDNVFVPARYDDEFCEEILADLDANWHNEEEAIMSSSSSSISDDDKDDASSSSISNMTEKKTLMILPPPPPVARIISSISFRSYDIQNRGKQTWIIISDTERRFLPCSSSVARRIIMQLLPVGT